MNVRLDMRVLKQVGMLLVGALLAVSVEAQSVRLATLAPMGTSMHKSLLRMGSEWRKAGVRLTVYPDGKMGGESQMVRRMRVNQLQAALLSVQGLSVIDESVRSVQLVPMMFRDLKEFDFAMSEVRSILNERLEKKSARCFSGAISAT